jgi:hypothetical protein
LGFVETPFDRLGNIRRHLGAYDGSSVEVLFEVKGHVHGERGRLRGSATGQ